jgi:hypothetical protein
MKLICIFIFTSIISMTSYGQNFEGEIIYHNSYSTKILNLSNEKFSSMMGTEQDYFVKGGQYKNTINGTLLQWQIYSRSENRMYTKLANNEFAIWNDAAINQDSVLSVVLNKEVIDGYKCDELILICKSGPQKYYFNSSLKMDPRDYMNHNFDNWYTYISNAKAIPLKIEIKNDQFTLISVAVEIKLFKLDDSVFQLPTGIKTEKSPY